MTGFSEISRRFFVKNSVVPFEEDSTHEFKGHRNISVEELPPWCYIPGTDKRSRKAVSRYKLINLPENLITFQRVYHKRRRFALDKYFLIFYEAIISHW